jgi:DNA-binding NarL/FixJ family response regulator
MAESTESTRHESVAVIDCEHAVHTAVKFWCSHARPPIQLAGHYLVVQQFLNEHPKPDIDAAIFDLAVASRRLDFDALDRIIRCGHRVVVYSRFATPEVILNSLDIGAVTYLTKSEPEEHLIAAIRAARTDSPYVGPRMGRAMLIDRTEGRPNLTAREKEVLMAWVGTESKSLVGQELQIATPTVRTHLQRIRAKYQAVGRPAKTKAALFARAIQDGIMSVDDL